MRKRLGRATVPDAQAAEMTALFGEAVRNLGSVPLF
jgi:hypothetical protein